MSSFIRLNKYTEERLNVNRLTLVQSDCYVTFDTGIRINIKGSMYSKQKDNCIKYGFVNVITANNENDWQKELAEKKENIMARIEEALTNKDFSDIAVKDAQGKVSADVTKQYNNFKQALAKNHQDVVDKIDDYIDELAEFDFKDAEKGKKLIKQLSSFESTVEDEEGNQTKTQKYSFTINNIKPVEENKRIDAAIAKAQEKKSGVCDRRKYEMQNYVIHINKSLLTKYCDNIQELDEEEQKATYTEEHAECMQIIQNNIGPNETYQPEQFHETECGKYYLFPASIPRDQILNVDEPRSYDLDITGVHLYVRVVLKTDLTIKDAYFQFEKLTLSSPKIKYNFHIKTRSKKVRGMVKGAKNLGHHIKSSLNKLKISAQEEEASKKGAAEEQRDSDEEQETKPKKPTKKAPVKKAKKEESDASDFEEAPKKPTKKSVKKPVSEEEASDEEPVKKPKKTEKPAKKPAVVAKSSDEDSEEESPKKSKKTTKKEATKKESSKKYKKPADESDDAIVSE